MNTDITINPNEMIQLTDISAVEWEKEYFCVRSYTQDELTKKAGIKICTLNDLKKELNYV